MSLLALNYKIWISQEAHSTIVKNTQETGSSILTDGPLFGALFLPSTSLYPCSYIQHYNKKPNESFILELISNEV